MRKSALLLAALALAPAAQAQQPAANEPQRISLRDAVITALQNNLDIAVTRFDPQIDQQSVVVAEAQFDPAVRAAASYQSEESEPSSDFDSAEVETWDASIGWVDPLQWGGQYSLDLIFTDVSRRGTAFFLPEQSDANLTFRYDQSLFRNFGVEINRTEIEQALVTKRISEAELERQVEQTIEDVEIAYWTLLGALRQYDVAVASLDLAKDFLRQTKIRVEVGTLPPIEITTAEAEVADREERVIVARTGIGNAEDALRALLRVPEDSAEWYRPLVPSDPAGFEPVQVDLREAVETGLRNRAEVRQAELAVRSAELTQRFQENQARPDLRASAFVSSGGNNFDATDPSQDRWESFGELLDWDNNAYGASLNYVYPIGNRSAKAQRTRARLATERSRTQLDAVKQAIRVEVRDAVRNLEANALRVATTRANVALQRKKLDSEQKRYENGLSTAFQVLEFQTDLRDAEAREINAIMDYNRALARLARATGTLLEQRGVTFDPAATPGA